MADVAPGETFFDLEDAQILNNDSSKIKTLAVNLNGLTTDIVICDYSDRSFIIITQFEKLGTLISVVKGSAKNLNGSIDVYDVHTISGLDTQEYHLAARYLAEQIGITKPVLFSISMKDLQLKTLKALSTILLENKIW